MTMLNYDYTQLGAALIRRNELIIVPDWRVCTGDEVRIGRHSIARRDEAGMLWVRFPPDDKHHMATGRMRMNALLRGMRLTHRYRFSVASKGGRGLGFSWRTHNSRDWTHRHDIPIEAWLPVAEGDLGALAVAAMMPAVLSQSTNQ